MEQLSFLHQLVKTLLNGSKWNFSSVYLRNKKKIIFIFLSGPPPPFRPSSHSRPGLPHTSPARPRPHAPALPLPAPAAWKPLTGGKGRCPLRPAVLRLQGCSTARTPPHFTLHPVSSSFLSISKFRGSSHHRAPPLLRQRRAPPPVPLSSIPLANSSASSSSFVCARVRLP